MDVDRLLQAIVQVGGSDLHLTVGNPPVARVNGELKMVQANAPLSPEEMDGILRSIARPEKVEAFFREKELDFSYGRPGVARFRVNACYQRGTVSLSFRILPAEIPSAQQLGLPPSCLEFVKQLRGLVLVTGPTGSGKSTTVAAMLNHINETTSCRVITLEDPIEFMHPNKRSMIIQREIGGDTHSFSESLRRALRQDPDVIMVGEMRDLETVSLALTAAETGHLVLGTLHTNGAAESIERLVGIHPPEQQQQVQFQLSIGITGVVYQSLIPRVGGKGRVAAFEVLVGTMAIKNLVRTNQIAQIRSYMFMGGQYGMQTLEQSMVGLVKRGMISIEESFARAPDRGTLEKLMELEGIAVPKEFRSSVPKTKVGS
jgi:twitching motility protein PilT